jgi:hypothetical protein
MASSNQCFIAFSILLLGATSGQSNPGAPTVDGAQSETEGYSVQADVKLSDSGQTQPSMIELRPKGGGRSSIAVADSTGRVVVKSVSPGTYDLAIEAVGFNTLSRTIRIAGDIDLGRVVMDPDPNILHTHSHGLESGFTPNRIIDHKPDLRPSSLRGRITPAPLSSGKRLAVQLSCSEQMPGLPQRPQTDLGLIAVDDTGAFQTPIPECSNDRLAHRELRFALQNQAGQTLALLLPKMAANGFHQSRFGVWLPVKPVLPDLQNEAVLAPEFTDNRPLQAKISVTSSSWGGLQATLTNTSDEVIAVRPADFFSDLDWIILDEHGERVPFRLFRDRTGEQTEERLLRNRLLFPGESEAFDVNIKLQFELDAPGAYRAVARRIIRRPELPGEQQIVSPEFTFVIAPPKRP